MAATMKGAISFGLLHVPISLHTATQDNDLHFNQLCREDGSRVKYKKVCASCGKEVSGDDIVKGFEIESGKYVMLTDEDFEKAKESNYKDMTVLNDEQLNIFMETIKNEPLWYDFFYTELTTGLRRGEICGLRWEDFNEKNKTLKIQRSLNCKMKVGSTKTDTGKRMILLPNSTYEILKNRKNNKITEWIFPSLICPEKPTSPNAAYRKMKELLKKADLPDIRFHDLRHTFATHAMKSGVDAKTLSGILGHTNASFTLDTYTHMTTDMQKSASVIVGDFLEDLFGKELKPWEDEEKMDLVL